MNNLNHYAIEKFLISIVVLWLCSSIGVVFFVAFESMITAE